MVLALAPALQHIKFCLSMEQLGMYAMHKLSARQALQVEAGLPLDRA